MRRLRRWERLIRSRVLGSPFVITNLLTRHEIQGLENLEAALEQRGRHGSGLISVSNHLSLFDDPLVLMKLLGLSNFTVESKCWWSTPCESNFNPRGKGVGPSFVRFFSDVANMVFFARSKKVGARIDLPERYASVVEARGGAELMERLAERAAREGIADVEELLLEYLTPGDENQKVAMLNQPGMIEACARISVGDWLHFFPEGGRSRTLHLKDPRRGVGKVIFHNPDALILPFCFYGTQDVLPVRGIMPRPFKRIVVSIGEPFEARQLLAGRPQVPTPDLYRAMAREAWESVKSLRPMTLARYLGPAEAAALLRAEAPASEILAGEAVGLPTQSSRPELRDDRSPRDRHSDALHH